MQRKPFLRAVLGALALTAAASVFAQTYPNKPVRVVIPFPPGGTLDAVGRMLAQKLGEQTGQSFVIDNKPGGSGVIGGDAVAKAAADGYTLLFSASTFTTAPMTLKSVPFSVTQDFAPVALVAKAPLSVAVNKDLPVTDIKSLLGYARSHPGKMTFAVGSIGSAGHLSTDAKLVEQRKAYQAHLAKMLTLAGEPNAAARAAAIVAFETQIARAHWTRIESRDANKTYNKMTVADRAVAPRPRFLRAPRARCRTCRGRAVPASHRGHRW